MVYFFWKCRHSDEISTMMSDQRFWDFGSSWVSTRHSRRFLKRFGWFTLSPFHMESLWKAPSRCVCHWSACVWVFFKNTTSLQGWFEGGTQDLGQFFWVSTCDGTANKSWAVFQISLSHKHTHLLVVHYDTTVFSCVILTHTYTKCSKSPELQTQDLYLTLDFLV